ncbi:MAG TPA: Gfo/Idh/MocA family oxidoreductase [Candidatus Brocadiia bacterium]|nr:Gfo/Idh/MocA family oxidoreductase [Candidatus Brocadiia bacterium]
MAKNRVKLIVAGCGGRGHWFVSQACKRKDYSLAALVDIVPGRAELTAQHVGVKKVPIFADLGEALDKVSCDAVILSTPDVAHPDGAVAALSRGCPVYVEKPLAISMEGCLRIVEADRASGGKAFVGFNLRYAPVYKTIRKMIADGGVGRILNIQTDEYYYGGRTYFRRWNRLRNVGGGLWITKSCHDLDLLYWITSAFPEKVFATAALTHYHPRPDAARLCRDCSLRKSCPDCHFPGGAIDEDAFSWKMAKLREDAGGDPADLCLWNSDKDTYDHANAQIEFAGDIIATHTVNVVSSCSQRRMRVSGTDGMIDGDLENSSVVHYKRHENKPREINVKASGGHGGGDENILTDFAAFVRGEKPSPISPAEASVSIAMGLACRLSSDRGAAVKMDEMPGWDRISGNS